MEKTTWRNKEGPADSREERSPTTKTQEAIQGKVGEPQHIQAKYEEFEALIGTEEIGK